MEETQLGYFRQNIAVDLGTSTVLVNVEGKGIVIKAPSLVAVEDGTNEIQAIGNDARVLVDRTNGEVKIVKPIKNGIISNYTTATAMLKYYLNKAVTNPFKKILKPDVMISIPCQTTNVEKRAVEQAALEAGARRVYLVYEPLAAAVGWGLDINKPCGNLVVDIGGGTTDIAVVSYGGIVSSRSVKVAGGAFDEAIKAYMKKKHGLLIGDQMAEQIKKDVGSLAFGLRHETGEVRGRDILTGLPNEKEVTSDELTDCLIEAAMPILDGIHAVLEETPPELAADIYGRGVNLSGGGSLVFGLDELIRKSTGIDVTIAENAEECVAVGAGIILKREKANK